MTDDDKSVSELLDEFIEQEKIYSNEGASGVKNLAKIIRAVGYKHWNKYQTPDDALIVHEFLEDNSGAIEVIIEWIASHDIPEWKESLLSNLNEVETEEDGE